MKSEQIIKNSTSVASLLKTLGHPQRLLILCFLKDKSMHVGELPDFLEIGQSQLSQFLKRMEREGLLKHQKKGQFVYYSILDEKVSQLIDQLDRIFCRGV